MKNKIIKLTVGICLCLLLNFTNAYAASSVSMGSSKGTIKVGETVTINISAKDMYVKFNSFSVSGPGQIVSKEPIDVDSGSSVSLTVKATGEGKITVTMSGVAARYDTEGDPEDERISRSTTITVANPSSNTSAPTTPTVDNRSKENTLSSLSVSNGILSPEFSASTTKYVVNVDASTSKLTIDAKPKDSKAKVSGTGEKTLKVGKNNFEIICTAENGSKKEYNIEVNVDEKPLIYLELGDQKLGVIRNLEGVGSPTGFEKTTTKMNDQDIDAWVNETINLTICYLIDDKGEKAFYIIEDGKVSYKFESVLVDERTFYVLPIEEKMKNRDGFEFKKVKISEGVELDGWVYKDETFKDYVQVYLMNEAGKKHIYDYEMTENQLQIYTEQKVTKSGINIFMITTGLFVLTSAGLLYLYLDFKKKSIAVIKEQYLNK